MLAIGNKIRVTTASVKPTATIRGYGVWRDDSGEMVEAYLVYLDTPITDVSQRLIVTVAAVPVDKVEVL